MGSGDESTYSDQGKRKRRWVVVFCLALMISVPTAGIAQVSSPAPFGQLDPLVREPICQVLRSAHGVLGGFPSVAAILTTLLQRFGCSGGTTPGTTTTTLSPTTTTTTLVQGTTTTLGTGTTGPTTSTSLPPCIPDNPSSTTVPCVSTTTMPTTTVP